MTAVELLRAQLEETHDRIRQVESQLRDAKVELATVSHRSSVQVELSP